MLFFKCYFHGYVVENYSLKFHAIDFRYAIGWHRHALLNCVMICFPNHCMQFTSLLWGLSWFEKEICPVLFFKTIEFVCHCGSRYLQQLVLLWKQHWSTDFWSSSQSATITRKWKTTAPFFSSTRFFLKRSVRNRCIELLLSVLTFSKGIASIIYLFQQSLL